jgi:hypothetical protein
MQAGAPFFMDPDNAGISAVIGYSSDRSETPLLTADVVHHHLAEQQVGQGLLGPDNTEWGKVSDIGQEIEIGKLGATPLAFVISLVPFAAQSRACAPSSPSWSTIAATAIPNSAIWWRRTQWRAAHRRPSKPAAPRRSPPSAKPDRHRHR